MESEALSLDDEGKVSTVDVWVCVCVWMWVCVWDGDGALRGVVQNSGAK